jgi:hypothetical protein
MYIFIYADLFYFTSNISKHINTIYDKNVYILKSVFVLGVMSII